MTLAITILIGVAIGAVVELAFPRHSLAELVLAMSLGTAGALLARILGERTGFYGTDEPMAMIASVIGSVATVAIYAALFKRKKEGSVGLGRKATDLPEAHNIGDHCGGEEPPASLGHPQIDSETEHNSDHEESNDR